MFFLALAAAIGILVPALSFLLPARVIAEFLEVRDTLAPADFIYLLGGDYELRAPAAAELFRNGWAPLIVVARESATHFTDVTKNILLANGVPASAVLELRPERPVGSTVEEANALRAFAEKRAPARIIVLTSTIHCRRARMMMRRILFGRNIDVRIWPAEPHPYTDSEIRKELTKYLYYSLTFW